MFDPVTSINRSPIYKVINLHIIHHKLDEDNGRAMIHYHLFRKYFVTNITYGGVGDKYVDFFTGHINALDRVYNKPTMEMLLEIYIRGEPYLRIYDESALEIAKTRKEMKETKDRVRDMQLENLMMKSKINKVERGKEENEKLRREMMELQSLLPII